ncbi:hypothetical protein [uncultured Subdoligranulum sp.]|uniref:hypothetical protein n=1 Tax=uncultured Subdoligranulum sp. TaxID=512298 RepID=UPI0026113D52|nr:hypothetical protein [uncultured Subdoligranulum sp.]
MNGNILGYSGLFLVIPALFYDLQNPPNAPSQCRPGDRRNAPDQVEDPSHSGPVSNLQKNEARYRQQGQRQQEFHIPFCPQTKQQLQQKHREEVKRQQQ